MSEDVEEEEVLLSWSLGSEQNSNSFDMMTGFLHTTNDDSEENCSSA